MRFSTNVLARYSAYHAAIRSASTQSTTSDQLIVKPTLRFDGLTALVTGAGRGLGREYALLLAARGANVVVNDPNEGGQVAERVVEQIASIAGQGAGTVGKALANGESVTDEAGVKRLVEATLDKFDRVDILINNAGILRDRSFAKMTKDDWDQVISVHLSGSFLVTHACWAQMRAQNYGRIVMTSSQSGLFGNFGQANYAAAKMGLIGLSNTLAVEGARNNIQCNTVVPMAATNMTQNLLPEQLASRLDPAHVAPLVAWLSHKDCQASGLVIEAAGKWYGRHRWEQAQGCYLPNLYDGDASIERIAANWSKISNFDAGAKHEDSFVEHLGEIAQILGNKDDSKDTN